MIRSLQRASFRSLVVASYVFLLAPLICVVVVSFNAEPVQAFPPTQWSLRWYAHALQLDSFRNGAALSFALALAASLVATPAGVLAAVGLHRSAWRGKSALEAVFLAPLVVPGVVTGISLLIALSAVDVREAPVRLPELAIRPEEIAQRPGADAGRPGTVVQAIYHGTTTSYIVRLADDQLLAAREPNTCGTGNAALRFAPGDAVCLHWSPDAVHRLDHSSAP